MNESNIQIRPETLRPADTWEEPTPTEVRELIRLAGLQAADVARLLGLTPQGNKSGRGNRTVRRWVAGDSTIPYAAWCLLAYQAGFGLIWVETPKRKI